ncbi:hypothetical protein Dsin_007217 [Dipteronia sinensis]|uniref:Uncharacterized protein n=1 Tax=Dipteronia sinensis TaxID=43782 RepID=A0AAE0B121_9ROSI|nr:hypothetical protein Dsin_007217 [Dipteronia sinensis]
MGLVKANIDAALDISSGKGVGFLCRRQGFYLAWWNRMPKLWLANKAAHCLAKFGLTLGGALCWMEDAPS